MQSMTKIAAMLLVIYPVCGMRQQGVDRLVRGGSGSAYQKGLRMSNQPQSFRALAGKRGKGRKGGSKGGDEESECNSEVQTVTTILIVNLEGVRPEDLDETRKSALEEAFVISYNRLTETNCQEGSFGIIISVTLDIDALTSDSSRRNLKLGGRGKGFPFYIKWGCNDLCPEGAKLLNNDAGRRRQLQDDLERHEGSNDCIPYETPTPEIFVVNYNDVIEKFEEELNITIATPTTVTELEVVEDCDVDNAQVDNAQIQETIITVPFDGDPAATTAVELDVVAEGALQTLNNLNTLNPDICDTSFRVVVSVTATVNGQAEDARRRSLQFKKKGIVLKIVWSCKNTCPSGANLLGNDAGRRQLQATNHPLGPIRALQTDPDQCLCPVGDVEFRPPTREEFDVASNDTLTMLNDDNEVTFVDEVGVSTETEEIPCPTEVDVRETFVAVEVDAGPATIQDIDIEALADIILATYTDLTSRLCNPDVRTIMWVIFVQVVGSDVSDSTNLNPQFRKKATIVYDIVFNCPWCQFWVGNERRWSSVGLVG